MGKTGVVRIADDRINDIVQRTFAQLSKEQTIAKEMLLQQVISDFHKEARRTFPMRLATSLRKPTRDM